MEFLVLLAGLIGLWFGTELTIRGAVATATCLNLSEFIVGIAILSIGSNLPELAIAIGAALKNLQSGQMSDIVVGCALGSGLAQIGFVLGVTGLIANLALPKKIIYQHGAVLLGSLVLLALLALDGLISRAEGLLLITVYVIYLLSILAGTRATEPQKGKRNQPNLIVVALYLIIGLVIVLGSAELTVSSASQLASALNIEQSFIATIILGLGSSLPEISISIAAAFKRRSQMSVGNLIGSNIFDSLLPIGVAAVIVDIQFDAAMLRHELPFLFALSCIVLFMFHRSSGFRKREAAIVIGLYLAYVAFQLVRL